MGNRVAALANGLSAAERVVFRWEVNGDCPLGWREVFPYGVKGVRFEEADGSEEVTRINGRPAMDWEAAVCRGTARVAYQVIAAAMGVSECSGAGVGVFGRFHRCPGARWEGLAEAANGEERVFLLTDRWRGEIAAALRARGCRVDEGESPKLVADLDRGVHATRAFLRDWKRLCGCGRIVALDGPSSLLHLARGLGTEIRYAGAGRLQGGCRDGFPATLTERSEIEFSNLSDESSKF